MSSSETSDEIKSVKMLLRRGKDRILQDEAAYLNGLVNKRNVHNVTKEGGCQNICRTFPRIFGYPGPSRPFCRTS